MLDARLEICGYCATPTWCEIRANGKPQCKACKVERFFDEVLYRPIGFRLLGWQRSTLRELYGTVDSHGVRIYQDSYLSIPKKNGKTFLVGGLPLFHLLMENVENPKAYGAAAAKDQASLVFDAAAQLVRKNPVLQSRLKVNDSTKRILRKDGNGSYIVLSADGDIQDGIEPSLGICDELHRWKAKGAEVLYDVLTKGTISRSEPLIIKITTAGEINESPICWREHEYAQQVLAGSLRSDHFYAKIWSANPERIAKDPNYWKTRESRVEANPSHEDNGGFLKDVAIVKELDKAIAVPQKQSAYLRYHLNIWAHAETRFIPSSDWAKCAAPTRPLIDRPCYVGVDLSSTIDLTAVVLVFPADDGTYDVLPFFFMAEDKVAERERQDRVPYSTWARQGYLELCPGFAIDRRAVAEKIKWATENFGVQEVCYDPWHGNELALDLIDAGMVCVKIPQNYGYLSEPTKKLAELCAQGAIRHGDHPILSWNADCATVKPDRKDNIMLAKPDRQKSSKRIDGMAALVNAMARALAHQPATFDFSWA